MQRWYKCIHKYRAYAYTQMKLKLFIAAIIGEKNAFFFISSLKWSSFQFQAWNKRSSSTNDFELGQEEQKKKKNGLIAAKHQKWKTVNATRFSLNAITRKSTIRRLWHSHSWRIRMKRFAINRTFVSALLLPVIPSPSGLRPFIVPPSGWLICPFAGHP